MELHLERGRIRAVMPNAVGVVIRTETRTYEFPGCVVLPGFVDNHAHILGLGSRLASTSLHDATSIAECRDRLQHAVIPDTGWLQAMGWNQELWTDGRMPSAADLDDLFPTTPVIASRVDGHAMWVNSEALRRAGITNSIGLLVEDEHPSGAPSIRHSGLRRKVDRRLHARPVREGPSGRGIYKLLPPGDSRNRTRPFPCIQ